MSEDTAAALPMEAIAAPTVTDTSGDGMSWNPISSLFGGIFFIIILVLLIIIIVIVFIGRGIGWVATTATGTRESFEAPKPKAPAGPAPRSETREDHADFPEI